MGREKLGLRIAVLCLAIFLVCAVTTFLLFLNSDHGAAIRCSLQG
jgi:disulfide bond formation protein DsbB